MSKRVRIVSALWVFAGIAIGGSDIWHHATLGHYVPVGIPDLIFLAFAALCLVTGITLGRTKVIRWVMVYFVFIIVVAYSVLWFVFDGIDDGPEQAPVLALLIALSIYSFVILGGREVRAP
ncbi:MAG: hypothetical protein WCV00_22550 [Verrucomicrobiia bacterium]